MEIEQLLRPDSVIAHLRASSKKQALQDLARRAAELTGLQERWIFDVLLERKRLARPGSAMASPYRTARSPGWIVSTVSSREPIMPIEFDAIDEQPVDLIFLLLVPEGAGADHLKALARVSRLLRDRVICEKLRGSESADALYALLTHWTASHAA